jgi:2-methylcitrate dehydratase PrpD
VLGGVRAALAARAGFGGDLTLLTPAWLAAQAAPGGARPEALAALPAAATAAVGLKPYVAARQGQNAIEAFRELLGRGLDPDTIERIEVALPPVATAVVTRPLDPRERLSGIAHLGLQLGIAAYTPERLYDIGREAPYDQRALAFAERVTVIADPALERAGATSWPARVRVTAAGNPLQTTCERLPGDAGDPHAAALVRRKIACHCSEQSAAPLHVLAAGRLDDAALAAAVPLLDALARTAPRTGAVA